MFPAAVVMLPLAATVHAVEEAEPSVPTALRPRET